MRVEERRRERLDGLRRWVGELGKLDEEGRSEVRRMLRQARQIDVGDGSGIVSDELVDEAANRALLEEVQAAPSLVESGQSLQTLTERNARLLEAASKEGEDAGAVTPSPFFYEAEEKAQARSTALGLSSPGASPPPTPQDLAVQFEWLQQDFWRSSFSSSSVSSVALQASTPAQLKMDDFESRLYEYLAHSELVDPAAATMESIQDAIGARDEQQEAAAEVITPPATQPAPAARTPLTRTDLDAISSRAHALRQSYVRSSSPLPTTIFDDCAHLCTLIRVPVLWTGSGNPHGGAKGEAEALAASLVLQGQADVVATEDSDVLLAEVPLLRGLTGSKRGMELVDSRGARRGLFPPKVEAPRKANRKGGAAQDGLEPTQDQTQDQPTPSDSSDKAGLARADKLSRYAMLEFALLCGTDYNRTITGLGPRGALKLLREHGGTIRGVLKGTGALNAAGAEGFTATSSSAEREEAAGSSSHSTISPTLPTSSSSSGSSTSAKTFSPPDNLTWKEYGGELSRARSVFRNPPDAMRALRLAGIGAWTGKGTASGVAAAGQQQQDVEKDEQGEEGLSIPGPAEMSIMDRLASTARPAHPALPSTAPTATFSTPAAQQSDAIAEEAETHVGFEELAGKRHFRVPEYDRRAVAEFLRLKGLGASGKGQDQGGNAEADESAGEPAETRAAASFWPTPEGAGQETGFGRAFGGEVASRRFAFDQ